jgi:DNA-binding MarR family transcriptional regulator
MREFEYNPQDMKIGKLIASIGRLQAIRADRFLEGIGLYRGQSFFLMNLAEQDGLTHSEIAEKLNISPAAATKVIKRLEELHFLQRRSDPADERISRVFLEEDGWAVIHQIKEVFQQMEQILCGDLSPEEKQTLHDLLARVYTNLLNHPIDPA